MAGVVLTLVGAWAIGPAVTGLAWALVALALTLWVFARTEANWRVRGVWLLFLVGNAFWFASDTWRVVGPQPFPAAPAFGPETLAAVGMAIVVVVIVWATYMRGRPRIETWLDGLILMAALAVPLWMLVVRPAAGDPEATVAAVIAVVSVLAVMQAGALYVMSGGIWSVPSVLLALAVAGNVACSLVPQITGDADLAVPLFVPGYVLGAFVAVHPQLLSVFKRGGRPSGIPLAVRVWMLVGAVSLPLAVLAWCYVQGEPAPTTAVAGVLGLITAVVVLRAVLMVRAGVRDWSVPLTISATALLVGAVAVTLTSFSQSARAAEERTTAVTTALAGVKQLDGLLLRSLRADDPRTAAEARAWEELVRRVGAAGVVAPATLDRYEKAGAAALTAAAAGQSRRMRVLVDGPVRATNAALVREASAALARARSAADRRAGALRLSTVAILMFTLLLVGVLLLRFNLAHRRLEVQHLKTHDELTGLPNRAALDRAVHNASPEFEGASRTLVVLDLDDFKAINDSFGRSTGDAVLSAVAARLAASIRGDQLLARVGGNAFGILVPHAADPVVVAHRALATLADPIEAGGTRHVIECSIGIARIDEADADRHASTMRNAELAMYHAKRIAGNSIETFVSDMHQRARDRLQLAADLRAALESDQLHLAYQPIVSLRTGEVEGYEALVRWTHPTRGPLSPAEFIPIAEQSALIVDLGGWVLRTAARQMADWQTLWDDERYVSVNVAASQLTTRALMQQVHVALADSQLDPERLVLEVTESSLIDDIDASIAQMDDVRALGVRFALDDFGTGYSSLSYLQRFPVDVLKIDKAFIDALDDPDGILLVRAIVNMAASLQLRVVAEGVEDQAQAEALQRFGCHLVQGYHFSRPMPASDVVAMPRTFAVSNAPAVRAIS